MPIYEYVCRDCGNDFERLQSFNDPAVTECPECNGPVRRVISAAGVIFKGSGWYITDHRRQISDKRSAASGDPATREATAAAASESGSSDTAPAKDTTTTDSAPAAAPAATTAAPAQTPATKAASGASTTATGG